MIKSTNEIKIARQLLNEVKMYEIKPDKYTAINLIRLLYYNNSNQKTGRT